MELLPAELRGSLPALYAQENERDPMVYLKFFALGSHWTWFVTEGSPEGDDFTFFGWIIGHEKELGYFSLKELESIEYGSCGARFPAIERDLYFTPMRLSEVKNLHEMQGTYEFYGVDTGKLEA